MNKKQFNFIAKKAIKNESQRKAVELVVLHGYTGYGAEMKVHRAVMNTVLRDAKKVRALYDWAMKVAGMEQ